ncbi:MAG: PE-PPE domain-containing protein [Mycobacterium sp.]
MRSPVMLVTAIAAVVTVGLATPVTAAPHLMGATALIMGGTGQSLSPLDPPSFVTDYLTDAVGFINASPGQPAITRTVAVATPEQFFPVAGLLTFNASVAQGRTLLHNAIESTLSPGNPVVVYGYSQSAVIASLEKQDLIRYYLAHPEETLPADLSFVLLANPMRPNGGILQRFVGLTLPLLDVTNYGAAPTNSADLGPGNDFPTVDISRQYDGWSDFPTYPLNVLATVNAILGIVFLHLSYHSEQMADAVEQGTMGDTTYYMIPSKTLPLLIPLELLGVPSPIIKILDAPLRALVEMGYDRQINPGEPVAAQWGRVGGDPVADLRTLGTAVQIGLDDGIEEVTGDRPFHTQPTDMYGHPIVDTPSAPAQLAQSAPPVEIEPVPAAPRPTTRTTSDPAAPSDPSAPSAPAAPVRDVSPAPDPNTAAAAKTAAAKQGPATAGSRRKDSQQRPSPRVGKAGSTAGSTASGGAKGTAKDPASAQKRPSELHSR